MLREATVIEDSGADVLDRSTRDCSKTGTVRSGGEIAGAVGHAPTSKETPLHTGKPAKGNKIGGANDSARTTCPSPLHTNCSAQSDAEQELPSAYDDPQPSAVPRSAKPIPPAFSRALSDTHLPGDTELGSLPKGEAQDTPAPQYLAELIEQELPSAMQKPLTKNVAPTAITLLPILIEKHRYRWQMIRARQRLELQGMAFCRRFCDGDKVAGSKLWFEVDKAEDHHLRVWVQPFFEAMKPLLAAQSAVEKELSKLVRQLPVYAWAEGIKGLGDVSLSAIIGECAFPVGEYKSVAAVWKRMGLAVINGGRQRRIAGDAAIEHGYNAERRAIMWNIGASLIKQQIRSVKGEDGKKIEGSSFPIGEFGRVYLERKAYELTKTDKPIVAHARAQRYMEKRLLRELWKAWRAAA